MKKKLTLLILLLPFVAFAQTTLDRNGVLTIDFGKKKKKEQTDTIQNKRSVYASDDDEDEPASKVKKQKVKHVPEKKQDTWDIKKDGLFKGLIHVGLNACQIDGDSYAGYNYAGFDGGIGVMVRFHKYVSVSMELAYSMKGAKQAFIFNPNPQTLQRYRTEWDYINVPISLNIHDKNLIMFSVGLAPGYMVRFNQRDEQGNDQTNNPNLFFGEPRKFDLAAFANLHFIIKKYYALGLGFNYSVLKIRGPSNLSRINGQYNNVLTLRFMMIMDKSMFKKKS